MPPVLPPRTISQSSSTMQSVSHLQPDASQTHPYSSYAGLEDPRSTSTQSLPPAEAPGRSRRTLLIVYIHGFMGNEDSFHSFPAHVHSLLTIVLAETHVVYTKIYPRYQSRKNISYARDAFSNWLYPHESENTDVVLAGHSLGGILAAEVVILPSHVPNSTDALQHRILGLIAYDTPFLGLHPGIVTTGIASLFRGNPAPIDNTLESVSTPSSETSAPFDTTTNDPHYNPSYVNDVKMPVRKNKWEKAWYFWNKHGGDIKKATQSYLKSHVEFGGCLTDYPGLQRRYEEVRSMEDLSDLKRPTDSQGKLLHRVRFVNYYTASSGRIKAQESSPTTQSNPAIEMQSLDLSAPHSFDRVPSTTSIPQSSIQEHRSDDVIDETFDESVQEIGTEIHVLDQLDAQPYETSHSDASSTRDSERQSQAPSVSYDEDLIPIPPEPEGPTLLELDQYSDTDAHKLAQMENARQTKLFEQAKKGRLEIIKEREKIIAKRKLQDEKGRQRAEKQAKREGQNAQKEAGKRQATLNPADHDQAMTHQASSPTSDKKKKVKDRKFCTLPSKDKNGRRDETWIRVYMEGIDEVAAHTSLFNMGETYSKLVGDTAERIEEWIRDDASTRTILLEHDSVDD